MTNKESLSTFALAAAALFLGACEKSAETATPEEATGAGANGAEIVKCLGVNECKGQSLCNTATTACAGENECKGKGWIKVARSECESGGGEVI